MRSEQHTRELSIMSPIEKVERTKRENLRRRWVVVEEYNRWIITHNEYPFTNRWNIQYVVWYNYANRIPQPNDFSDLFKIRLKYPNLTMLHNSNSMMSVQDRFHIHLYN